MVSGSTHALHTWRRTLRERKSERLKGRYIDPASPVISIHWSTLQTWSMMDQLRSKLTAPTPSSLHCLTVPALWLQNQWNGNFKWGRGKGIRRGLRVLYQSNQCRILFPFFFCEFSTETREKSAVGDAMQGAHQERPGYSGTWKFHTTVAMHNLRLYIMWESYIFLNIYILSLDFKENLDWPWKESLDDRKSPDPPILHPAIDTNQGHMYWLISWQVYIYMHCI